MARMDLPSVATALVTYTERLQTEVTRAAGNVAAFLHERTVARARMDPDWMPLADNIEVWSQDGYLIIGIKDEQFASQAFALEYGDAVRPPNPLFRSMSADVREAGYRMDADLESALGYGGRFS